MRPEHNFYLLDGVSAFEPFSVNPSIGSRAARTIQMGYRLIF